MTELDQLHQAMEAGDEGLAFWRAFADAELFLLLESEAAGEVLAPRLFETEEARLILAFDTEERLADFAGAPLPYAALPGRVIAQQMAGQGLSLGLNLGSGAASETVLPPEALDWLLQMLDQAPPEALEARIAAVSAPRVPQAVLDALAQALSGLAGQGVSAQLAGVTYADGRQGQLLAVTGLASAAKAKLARAVTEALAFSGIEAGALDLAFPGAGDALLARLSGLALVLDLEAAPLPEESVPEPRAPRAPGTDPERPPILR